MKLLWKHPTVIRPSHMNVMSQKCECRIFRGFFMDQLNFCGTNRKVRHDEINCHYWKLNSILFHWCWSNSAQHICQWNFHAFLVLHIKWLVWEAPHNQSLDPWGNFHHVLPIYQDQWLLISLQSEFFSI